MGDHKDRIDQAHAQRSAIHAWLRDNPRASIAEIAGEFPAIKFNTLRRSVQILVKLGYVEIHERSTRACYSAHGEAIYSADSVRVKLRSGKRLGLNSHNRDQIARSWQARKRVHEFVAAHPLCRMDSIIAAFGDIPADTVSKHVRALRNAGNIVMHGKSIAACYSCATSFIYSEESVREKLRSNGRAVGAMATSRHKAYCELKEQAERAEHDVPGRYVNRPDRQRPHRNQEGQGSGSANCWRGHSTLERVA